ncbi:MAG: RNA-binding protein [Anaerolineae bacterium]|nr:RNA-binding protein [Thermoflexales bacterium]MDW8396156.1 RNA-binding protein [Anaerolineae bacterium]
MNTKLYVGNLPFDTSEAELRDLFSRAGDIRAVTIPIDRMTNRPRGFAFVEMGNTEQASAAIRMFNGHNFEGRTLNVSEARPPEARSSSGGFSRDSRNGSRDRRSGSNRRW